MLDDLVYIDHNGDSMAFGDKLFANEGTLYDSTWLVTRDAEVVKSIRRSVASRTLPVRICCSTDAEGLAMRDRLAVMAESDLLAMEPGRLVRNGWSMRAYIVAAKKSMYLLNGYYMRTELTIEPVDGTWTRETVLEVNPNSGTGTTSASGKGFPYDYPYNYGASSRSIVVSNPSAVPCDFRLLVYGPASSPYVWIGSNLYQVSVDVAARGQLVIDSTRKHERGKGVVLLDKYGNATSVFSRASKGDVGSGRYVYEKLPTGRLEVSWPQTFGFQLTFIESRGEPGWS